MEVTTPAKALLAIQNYLIDRPVETPDDVRAKLRELSSPEYPQGSSMASAEICHLIYARHDDLAPELKEIGASIAMMLAGHSMYGMKVNDLGANISTILRGGSVDEPPEPKAEYALPVEPPEEPEQG